MASVFEIRQWFDKMEAPDFASEAMIESVRRVVVGVAVEHKNVALFFSRHELDFLNQRGSDSAIPVVGMHDEVIDFHVVTTPDFRAVPHPREAREPAVDVSAEDAVVGKFTQDFFITSQHRFLTNRWIEKTQKLDDFRHGRNGKELQIHISGKWQSVR